MAVSYVEEAGDSDASRTILGSVLAHVELRRGIQYGTVLASHYAEVLRRCRAGAIVPLVVKRPPNGAVEAQCLSRECSQRELGPSER